MHRILIAMVVLVVLFGLHAVAIGAGEGKNLAPEIVRATGIRSGLCVHVGADDGHLAVEVAQSGKFLVHAWVAESAALAKVRNTIQLKGSGSQVFAEQGSLERLPYADHLVNLVVVDDLAVAIKQGLTLTEVMRVLAPRGVAYLGQRPGSGGLNAVQLRAVLSKAGIKDAEVVESSGVWAKITKPRQVGTDEWTHYNYDPTGSRVSRDALAGPPGRVRWLDGPTWPTESLGPNGAVTAGGRLFYVSDYAPENSKAFQYWLVARDAHNGLLLWKKQSKAVAPQALIATSEKLFTVVDPKGPLVAFDAATGEVRMVYKEGGGIVEWAIHHDGKLLISAAKQLRCLDAATGRSLWKSLRFLPPSGMSNNVAVDGKLLYFVDAAKREVGCLELETGVEKWSRPIVGTLSGPTVDVGLSSYGKGVIVVGESGKRTHGNGIHGFSAQDGKHLWSQKYDLLRSGSPNRVKAASYLEVFLIDGLFWVLVGDKAALKGDSWHGLDPASGAVKARCEFPAEVRISDSCQRARATERFLIGGHADFVDVRAGKYAARAEGVHGGCGFGMLPGNGLIYTWSRYTSEYLRAEMGLDAMPSKATPIEVASRLEKGPAHAKAKAVAGEPDDWPCYRHDAARSSHASTSIKGQPAKVWETILGGRLSPPTVAAGMVFVSAIDEHRVLALDAESGKIRWSFVAGGRVPIPPTYFDGSCLFGAADGWVYCLRAKDGELAWRYRAAPTERRIVAHGQLESPWPVAGGVIVVDGLAYFAAGRHGTLDGGVHVHALDAVTGKTAWMKQHRDGPVLGLLLSDGKAVRMGPKASFNLKTGERASGSLDLTTAFDPGMLSVTSILKITERKSAAYVNADVRSLIRSDQTLYAIGWPQGSDPELRKSVIDRPFSHFPDDKLDPKNCQLWAFSIENGKKVYGQNIDVSPVFDGLAAAHGRLYLATRQGKVICFGKE